MLSEVSGVQPCRGISRQHVVDAEDMQGGSADVWHSVVRQAQRNIEGDDDLSAGDRWGDACVRGLTAGEAGVSGVLGLVGGRDVLWSKNCAAVASGNARTAGGAGPRCAKCKEFWRVTVKPKIKNFLSPAHKHTTDKDLSTGQKVSQASTNQRGHGMEWLVENETVGNV